MGLDRTCWYVKKCKAYRCESQSQTGKYQMLLLLSVQQSLLRVANGDADFKM